MKWKYKNEVQNKMNWLNKFHYWLRMIFPSDNIHYFDWKRRMIFIFHLRQFWISCFPLKQKCVFQKFVFFIPTFLNKYVFLMTFLSPFFVLFFVRPYFTGNLRTTVGAPQITGPRIPVAVNKTQNKERNMKENHDYGHGLT